MLLSCASALQVQRALAGARFVVGRSTRNSGAIKRQRAMASCSADAAAAAVAPAGPASPAECSVHTWDVGGQPTEVLEVPAGVQKPEVHLVVIPGNPGAAPFYVPFMKALHRQLGGRATVTCVSNLGMDGLRLCPRGRVYSLEDQIVHKLALLREHFAGPGRPPVVLMGHSIGTYMCIHALHRLENPGGPLDTATAAIDAVAQREWEHPDTAGASLEGMAGQLAAEQERQRAQQAQQAGPATSGVGEGGSSRARDSNVVKVIGLFPFLQFDPECSAQRRLQRITPHHALLSRLAGGVLGPLPLPLRRALVRTFSSGLDPHAVDVAANVFASAACVDNGLYMGMTEFETLAAPAQWWLLQWLGPRFAAFAAPGDVWFKQWKWDAMHQEVPGVEAYFVDDQAHAFCVSNRQSEDLAAHVTPIVEAALAQPKL